MAVVQLMTAEQLLRVPSDVRCELIDGVLIEMSPPGALHGKIAGKFAVLLARAEDQGLGHVLGEVGFIIRRNPDTVRAPDVAFIRKERVPANGFPPGYWDIPPDLVVEVVSPYDTQVEIQIKIREWIEFGVPLVVVAYPETHTIDAVESLRRRVRLTVGDTLDLGAAIPGFTVPVADIFQ